MSRISRYIILTKHQELNAGRQDWQDQRGNANIPNIERPVTLALAQHHNVVGRGTLASSMASAIQPLPTSELEVNDQCQAVSKTVPNHCELSLLTNREEATAY